MAACLLTAPNQQTYPHCHGMYRMSSLPVAVAARCAAASLHACCLVRKCCRSSCQVAHTRGIGAEWVSVWQLEYGPIFQIGNLALGKLKTIMLGTEKFACTNHSKTDVDYWWLFLKPRSEGAPVTSFYRLIWSGFGEKSVLSFFSLWALHNSFCIFSFCIFSPFVHK